MLMYRYTIGFIVSFCVAEIPIPTTHSSTIISRMTLSSLRYASYNDRGLYVKFLCAVVWTEASDQRSRLPAPIWSLCYSSSYHGEDHRRRGKYMYIHQPCVTDHIVGSIHRKLVHSSTQLFVVDVTSSKTVDLAINVHQFGGIWTYA